MHVCGLKGFVRWPDAHKAAAVETLSHWENRLLPPSPLSRRLAMAMGGASAGRHCCAVEVRAAPVVEIPSVPTGDPKHVRKICANKLRVVHESNAPK